jgi:hypothetical protein
MDHTIAFDAPAERIYQTFVCREYWQTLLDTYRSLTPQSEIADFHSDRAGTDIVVTQTLARTHLPPIARKVWPVDIVVRREQHFDPYNHAGNRAQGEFRASVQHGPGHFGGRYFLAETDTGSQLRLASVCRFAVPLIGGKLEELVLHYMKVLFAAEEAFTADWIARHH